jgi:hypothetical protein
MESCPPARLFQYAARSATTGLLDSTLVETWKVVKNSPAFQVMRELKSRVAAGLGTGPFSVMKVRFTWAGVSLGFWKRNQYGSRNAFPEVIGSKHIQPSLALK